MGQCHVLENRHTLPIGQTLQLDAAGLENVPDGQSEQYVLWASDANVPLAHAVQPASPAVEYVPTPHAMHAEAPCEEYLPAL